MVQKKDGEPLSAAPKEDDAPETGNVGGEVVDRASDAHVLGMDVGAGDRTAVTILGAGTRMLVPPGSLVIICTTPGMRRAGVEHKLVAVHDEDRFSTAQLTALRADPAFVVIEVD